MLNFPLVISVDLFFSFILLQHLVGFFIFTNFLTSHANAKTRSGLRAFDARLWRLRNQMKKTQRSRAENNSKCDDVRRRRRQRAATATATAAEMADSDVDGGRA